MKIGQLKEYPLLYNEAILQIDRGNRVIRGDVNNCLINNAFTWSGTPQGQDFWMTLSRMRDFEDLVYIGSFETCILRFPELFIVKKGFYIRDKIKKIPNGLWKEKYNLETPIL